MELQLVVVLLRLNAFHEFLQLFLQLTRVLAIEPLTLVTDALLLLYCVLQLPFQLLHICLVLRGVIQQVVDPLLRLHELRLELLLLYFLFSREHLLLLCKLILQELLRDHPSLLFLLLVSEIRLIHGSDAVLREQLLAQ